MLYFGNIDEKSPTVYTSVFCLTKPSKQTTLYKKQQDLSGTRAGLKKILLDRYVDVELS